jgi:acyl-CoA reductase-like NAD-dependent aldehyde dehydrogenase
MAGEKSSAAQASSKSGAAIVAASPPSARVRLSVQKAYKMYVGGEFIRSESGRYVQVADAVTGERENTPKGSRKDARDAVTKGHAAFAGWSGRTAYNRGQILYRLAEIMEARSEDLARELRKSTGQSEAEAEAEVLAAIDRVVHYAGWSDKIGALLATSNPVSGPHFNFTVPEPMGLVVVLSPQRPALLGLVTAILPVIVSGNTALVLVSEDAPRLAQAFGECLATSDLPGGVVNLLTASLDEVAPHLAKHMEVASLAIWAGSPELRKSLDEMATNSVKRVRQFHVKATELGDERHQGLRLIERFIEQKTVWHPVGL